VDPTIKSAMEMAFAEGREALRQLGLLTLQAAGYANQQVQLSHQRTAYMYEAKALQNLESEGIADAILQNRSARDQPDVAPK